jgi:hypothetical protein
VLEKSSKPKKEIAMRSEYKGHVIETVAEPKGTKWQAELTVRRRPAPQDEPEIHRESLPEDFATAEQAERAALEKGELFVDGQEREGRLGGKFKTG